MNVYIMTDIEGISGIYSPEQVSLDGRRFDEGRRFITEDINACVRGLKAGGADKIYVHDCHGGGYSVIWEQISSDVTYCISGNVGYDRFAHLEDCDAVVLLGYHAMAGTQQAVLEHTYSSKSVQNMYINGIKVGELGIDAAIVGEQGKPVIMVSGDDKICKEAEEFLPGVITAEVKKGLSSFGAMLLPKEKAHNLIFQKAKEAVQTFHKRKPYVIEAPVTIRLERTERIAPPNPHAKPYMKLIDGRTYEVSGETVLETFCRAFY